MFLKPDSEDNILLESLLLIEEILKTIAVLEPPLGERG
jgi:hypothetical protein